MIEKLHTSHSIEDIAAINRRSVDASSEVRIVELSSLDQLIPLEEAEAMRQQWLERGVQVLQLTNQQVFDSWTAVDGFVERCMEVRYVSPNVLPINWEMLQFDDVVARYRTEPTVDVFVWQGLNRATLQQKQFDWVWERAEPLALQGDGSTAPEV